MRRSARLQKRVTVCHHVHQKRWFNTAAVKKRLSDPSSWTCSSCGHSGDVWTCVTCGHVGCGRSSHQHSLAHHAQCGHPLVLEFNSGAMHCYACDADVFESSSELDELRVKVGEVLTLDTRSRSLAQMRNLFLGPKMQAAAHRRDRMCTAIRLWEAIELRQSFKHWFYACGINPAASAVLSTSLAAKTLAVPGSAQASGLSNLIGLWAVPSISPVVPLAPVSPDFSSMSTVANDEKSKRVRHRLIPGRTGLRNIGNSCFVNSVFQALSHVQTFRNFFTQLFQRHVEDVVGLYDHTDDGINISGQVSEKTGAMPPEKLSERRNERRTRPRLSRSSSTTSSIFSGSSNHPSGINNKIPKVKAGADCLKSSCNVSPLLLKRQSTFECHEMAVSRSNKTTAAQRVSLCMEVHSLLRVLWSGRWAVVSPYALVYSIWRFVPRFRSFQQQDAQEFFTYLLEALHTELHTGGASGFADALASGVGGGDSKTPSVRKRGRKRKNVDDEQTKEGLPRGQWFEKSEFIHEAFEGAMQSSIICHRCKSESVRTDPFVCLSLDIPSVDQIKTAAESKSLLPLSERPRRSKVFSSSERVGRVSKHRKGISQQPRVPARCTLDDCFRLLTKKELLSGDSSYFCGKCGAKVNATKRFLISKAPRVLVLHVNRARWLLHGAREKLRTHVEFPVDDLFNLTDYCASVSGEPKQQPQLMYTLRAVVQHHGKNIDKGHYSTMANGSELNSVAEWHQFNDMIITPLTESKLARAQAYMLFLELSR